MKRILLFLGLLLTFFVGVDTAWAGSQTIPQLSTNGNMHFYAIKNLRTNKYLYWNGNSDFIRQSESLNGYGLFYFTAGSATTTVGGVTVLKIHNLATTTLMNDFQSWNVTGIDWYVKAASGTSNGITYTGIAFSKSTLYGETKDSWNSYDSDKKIGNWSIDGGSIFEVEELTEAQTIPDAANIFLKPLIDEYQSEVNKPFSCSQEAFDALSQAYNKYNTATSFTTTDLESIKNAQDAFIHSTPTSTSFDDGTAIILSNLESTNTYVCADNNSLKAKDAKDNYAYEWILKKQDNGYYKIFNPYSNKYVGAFPTTGGWNNDGNDVAIPLVTDMNEAADFKFSTASKLGYVTIRSMQSGLPENRSYMHMTNGLIVRWEASPAKSQFKIIQNVTDIENDWDTAIKNKVSNINKGNGTYVGTFNANVISEPATAFNNATTSEDKGSTYAPLEAAIANPATRNTPEAGKYYTISNATNTERRITENYSSKIDNKNKLTGVAYNNNIVPSLWKFESVTTAGKTDLYHIVAANSGKYLSKICWDYKPLRMVDANDANIGEFDIFDKTHVNKENAVTLVTYTNNDRSADHRGTACDVTSNNQYHNESAANEITSWNMAVEGSNFRIVEVTTIPVNITSAGYATLNLPMAVNIPTGVKAYTGQKEGNELKLTAITTGIIPAETPVVIEGAEGKHNFDINYDNTATIANNGLNGTLIPTAIDNDATAYVLGNGSKGTAFYKVTSETDRTIGANKAYAGSTTVDAAANVLIFNFSDITTGINNAATSQGNNNTYYDLNGRRVLYPAHGIFVKENGQKVFIK